MPTVFNNIDTPFLENEHINGLKDARPDGRPRFRGKISGWH
jgi:hypothetical protein